ncbi:PAS domain-containing sensor histidine kinase [Mesorhizobium loti]|nr:HWE histidine kinase domain-containing protein [Mesorhizobium loti]
MNDLLDTAPIGDSPSNTNFLSGGGEMGSLTRAYDWNKTGLGPPQGWPQSLRTTVKLMLQSRHPMFIWWGPDLIQFYNDAYRATLGPERHPTALGDRGKDCWAEIWHIIGPQIEYVMAGKGSTWHEDALVPVTRNGKREDVWWTYSYGPIDVDGEVGGVLVICNDVTERHLAKEALEDHTRYLEQLFEQAPGFIAVLQGPNHVFEIANAAYKRLVGDRTCVGKTVRDVIPEMEGQGFFELLDEVYRTGVAHVGRRVPVIFAGDAEALAKTRVVDFVYQPIILRTGESTGIFCEGIDVTDHVQAEEHLRLMNQELKHRVKNTLAMVSAIAGQTLRGTPSAAALATFHGRLAAFGKAHDTLTADTWATASVRNVVHDALEAHRTGQGRFIISGPEITLGSKQALSLALATHELATNAAKYGALSNNRGTVHVSWREEREGDAVTFHFEWIEAGGPPVTAPVKEGFGTRLVNRVLSADFGARVEIDYAPGGLVCRLLAPIQNLNQDRPICGRVIQMAKANCSDTHRRAVRRVVRLLVAEDGPRKRAGPPIPRDDMRAQRAHSCRCGAATLDDPEVMRPVTPGLANHNGKLEDHLAVVLLRLCKAISRLAARAKVIEVVLAVHRLEKKCPNNGLHADLVR